MSIEQEKPKKKLKKINKAVIKNKIGQGRRVKSLPLSQAKIMKSFSKEVNAKKRNKTLH